MGQKTHPIGYRLGYNYTWSSRWYASKDYAKLLHQDIKIRKVVKQKLFHAGVAKVEIERSGDQTRVIIHTARPGIIIGRKGAEVDKLKAELEKQYGGQVYITVKEIKKPELDAARAEFRETADELASTLQTPQARATARASVATLDAPTVSDRFVEALLAATSGTVRA